MPVRHAIVLAGGFGTRLQSLVSDVPKPMADIAGRPFLSWLLDWLSSQGIESVVLATGHLADKVEAFYGDHFGGLEVRYSREESPLGTGGAVLQALSCFDSRTDVLILNGDSFFDCDLGAIAKTHYDTEAEISLALTYRDPADRYGLVQTEGPWIRGFNEKQAGSAGLINAGLYILKAQTLLDFNPPQRFSLESEFFAVNLDRLRVAAHVQEGYFIDIGIPEDYQRAQVELPRLFES